MNGYNIFVKLPLQHKCIDIDNINDMIYNSEISDGDHILVDLFDRNIIESDDIALKYLYDKYMKRL